MHFPIQFFWWLHSDEMEKGIYFEYLLKAIAFSLKNLIPVTLVEGQRKFTNLLVVNRKDEFIENLFKLFLGSKFNATFTSASCAWFSHLVLLTLQAWTSLGWSSWLQLSVNILREARSVELIFYSFCQVIFARENYYLVTLVLWQTEWEALVERMITQR